MSPSHSSGDHAARIADQFGRQAEGFARSPALHGEAALGVLVEAAAPVAGERMLDVACGPGTVVAAFAPRVRHATGIDATEPMLEQARALAAHRGLTNVAWHRGDAYHLPFPAASFDIVTSRFAFHHLEDPTRALAEMVRVCRPEGRVLVCDALASDDPRKARAFNAMERLRDPSTVAFRTLGELQALFDDAGLPAPALRFYQVPAERDDLVGRSYPAGGDREGLRQLIDDAVEGDRLGMSARRDGATVRLFYPAAVLVSRRGPAG